jgi:hypothetical protein
MTQLTTIDAVRAYAMAGNATLTLRSKRTEARFTFRIRKARTEGRATHWVQLMTGPDNEASFARLGMFTRQGYAHGGYGVAVGREAPGAKAFDYFAECLRRNELPAALEVFHEGRCGACGRKLTVPESILTGLGPECAGRAGVSRTRVRCDETGVAA